MTKILGLLHFPHPYIYIYLWCLPNKYFHHCFSVDTLFDQYMFYATWYPWLQINLSPIGYNSLMKRILPIFLSLKVNIVQNNLFCRILTIFIVPTFLKVHLFYFKIGCDFFITIPSIKFLGQSNMYSTFFILSIFDFDQWKICDENSTFLNCV